MSQVLTAEAAARFTQLQSKIAQLYGVETAAEMFSATPTMEQTLHDAITEEIDFLQRINVLPVRDLNGQKVFGGLNSTITKRTDTDSADREVTHPMDTTGKNYQLYKTESDVGIKYALIDMWSKFPNFMQLFTKHVRKQIALDRIMVGWHGVQAATTTNKATYPLLQDVNKGWLQLAREEASSQVLAEGANAGQIQLGATGDYKTLDQMVADVKTGIHTRHRTGGDLIAIIGEDLLSWDEGKLYETHGNTPTEKAGIKMALKSYGGLPSMTVPFFPANGLVVTSLDNLSIYYQQGSTRRKVADNPKRDQIEDYNSRNEGYAVEDYDKFVGIEADNVTFV